MEYEISLAIKHLKEKNRITGKNRIICLEKQDKTNQSCEL